MTKNIEELNLDVLIQKILDIKKEEHEELKKHSSSNEPLSIDGMTALLNKIHETTSHEDRVAQVLKEFGEEKVRLIYALYYYGRDNMTSSTSYFELLNMEKNQTLKEMILKIKKAGYDDLKSYWEQGKYNFKIYQNKEIINER